ncbi:sigma-54-dependent Fis family transcriptional regulator [Kroppenstedtia guangzhouensis]|uniref:Sigma-54-dependent Fis family transcriptional regulator n=1 Tax=Kroppenstedtia guangzhouensis TaxID=1274356 RepID=A0ABQ1G9Q5_9BACL|nr:sigma-54-dependent Fis family transcriptional regulator [Kroppenstedtia guangzhouensis]GGA39517.1 sigma-54-dependent Fis family transcriptional regulator [Kroppenstedtia guangzhouensis]
MKRFLIVGGGEGGTAFFRTLIQLDRIRVTGVVDLRPEAPAILEAKRHGIPTGQKVYPFLKENPDVVLEVTGDPAVYRHLCDIKGEGTLVVPGEVANLIMQLIAEKEQWFEAWRVRQHELDAIVNSTHDGMIAVNREGRVTLFNRAAERLIGKSADQVMGKKIGEVLPDTCLDQVLQTGKPELNQSLELANGKKIVTNREPVTDREGKVIGVVSVFRDITEVTSLVQQVTDLKSMKSQLQAIIDSSDDAISVVDTKGLGVLINPAYTRLTGLTPPEVIGKPADTDISEGESMHMKVLRTGKPVRGVPMKVGSHRKDVVVNAAPITVEGKLKGSVAIIQDMSEIKELYRELERFRRLVRTLEAKYTFDDIIGESEAMRLALKEARQGAHTRATVLLRGESGTGKELFAHAIHNASDRKYNQFVRVNCASIPESLLESELFGYEEGAFTGARRGGKKGFFEEADGGTIFLDEIGELSLSTQAKLLRVLQEKEIVRVGGAKPVTVDVRVIAATHVDLEQAIKEKRFREDLYYRLNLLPIHIPPLRQRVSDIQALSLHLVKNFNQEYGRNVISIHRDALHVLETYNWPGNVRELENVLGRAMIHMHHSEREICKEHLLPLPSSMAPPAFQEGVTEEGETLQQVVSRTERAHILRVFEETGGNKTETARRLGISVRNLYYKLERYQISNRETESKT